MNTSNTPPMLSLTYQSIQMLTSELLRAIQRIGTSPIIDRPISSNHPTDRALTQLTITLMQAVLDTQNVIATINKG